MSLQEEWPIGPMGLPYRQAARVIIIDPHQKQVLLVRGHDFNDPSHTWWFTVGGGLAKGENHRQGAVRECLEETGICARVEELQGPVIERRAMMYFADRLRCQDEQFFLLHTARTALDRSAWTADERQLLDEMRWFNAEELGALAQQTIPIYPPELTGIITQLLAAKWDGQCVKIDEYSEAGTVNTPGNAEG